jgi:predicted PurR-regulated permease PerM
VKRQPENLRLSRSSPVSDRRSEDEGTRIFAGIIATIAVFIALYLARDVFAPVAAALFIIAITWPLQRHLQARIPQLLALTVVILAIAVVFVAFTTTVAWSLGRVGRWLVANTERFQQLYEQAVAWFDSHGIGIAALWAEHFNVRWLVRAVQEVAGRINTTVGFWLVVIVYVILGLVEVDDASQRIERLKSRDVARVLLEGCAMTAAKFRHYLLIRTLMSIVTGLLVYALASLAGLQLTAEWGAIAFALNYIPFIGPFIATVLPTLFALAQIASWQAAVAVFIGLNVIQFMIGSYIEPRVSGGALAISPFLVLLSVFFWMYLWGLFGAFIGVPITIAILTFSALHPTTQWLAQLLGGTNSLPLTGAEISPPATRDLDALRRQ